MKKLNILYAPIHYILDKQNSGSEFLWAYEIYKRVRKSKELHTTFITGGVRDVEGPDIYNCNVFNPLRLNLALNRVLLFYFKVFRITLSISQEKDIDIIHHVLPFFIGKTFNFGALFLNKKFVIGPIQSPLTMQDTDLSIRDARGFKKSEVNPIALLSSLFLVISTPILNILSLATLKKASKIIVINKKTKNLLSQLGIKRGNIIIIPPGIVTSKFTYIPFDKKKSQTIRLLTTGYLLKRKGVDLILNAISIVVKSNKNVLLTMVGDGPQMSNLKSLAHKLHIENYIEFVGFIPNNQIHKYYQSSHIYLNMSHSEGFATVSLEASASGLAIISSKVGGFEDIIEDGVNGFLVNQNDYRELANKIKYLIRHSNEIEKMGKNARKSIESAYDWGRHIIPRYLDLYSKM